MCQRWSTEETTLFCCHCALSWGLCSCVDCGLHISFIILRHTTRYITLKNSFQTLAMAPVKGDGPNCFQVLAMAPIKGDRTSCFQILAVAPVKGDRPNCFQVLAMVPVQGDRTSCFQILAMASVEVERPRRFQILAMPPVKGDGPRSSLFWNVTQRIVVVINVAGQ